MQLQYKSSMKILFPVSVTSVTKSVNQDTWLSNPLNQEINLFIRNQTHNSKSVLTFSSFKPGMKLIWYFSSFKPGTEFIW